MKIFSAILKYTALARLFAALSGSKTAQKVVNKVAPIVEGAATAGKETIENDT